jgi:hypothetical protein
MSTPESLEDWEVIELGSLLSDSTDPPIKLAEDFEYLSSQHKLERKDRTAPILSKPTHDSQGWQRQPLIPIQASRGSIVARAVQAIEQAISSEGEKPNSCGEGVAEDEMGRTCPEKTRPKYYSCSFSCNTIGPGRQGGAAHCTLGCCSPKVNRILERGCRII